jgi:hypothetical protein
VIKASPHPQDPAVVGLTCEEREPLAEALGMPPRRSREGWRLVVERSKLQAIGDLVTWPTRKRSRLGRLVRLQG